MDGTGVDTVGHGRVRVTAMLPAQLLQRVRDISAATGVATRDVLTLCLYVGLAAGQSGGADRRADDGTNQNRSSGNTAGE